MKLVFLLLLLLNVALSRGSRGRSDFAEGGREPERIARQLYPSHSSSHRKGRAGTARARQPGPRRQRRRAGADPAGAGDA